MIVDASIARRFRFTGYTYSSEVRQPERTTLVRYDCVQACPWPCENLAVDKAKQPGEAIAGLGLADVCIQVGKPEPARAE